MIASNWRKTFAPARFPMNMEKYLRLMMIYPKNGLDKRIEGVVDVEFTIKQGR